MSGFSVDDLRRLSRAATKGPWHSEPGSGDTHWIENAYQKPIGEFSAWDDNELVAYLGTHRDAIIAQLEAADALAAAVQRTGRWCAELGAYKKASGDCDPAVYGDKKEPTVPHEWNEGFAFGENWITQCKRCYWEHGADRPYNLRTHEHGEIPVSCPRDRAAKGGE